MDDYFDPKVKVISVSSNTEKQEKILTHIIEECSKVIQAACKAKRFGLDTLFTTDEFVSISNMEALSKEWGQLVVCMSNLNPDQESISLGMQEKQWYFDNLLKKENHD